MNETYNIQDPIAESSAIDTGSPVIIIIEVMITRSACYPFIQNYFFVAKLSILG